MSRIFAGFAHRDDLVLLSCVCRSLLRSFSNGEFFCLARDTPCDRFDNLTSCQANNCTWFTTTTGNTSSVGSVPMLSNWRQSTNFLTATVAPHAETSWCAHEESVVSLALMVRFLSARICANNMPHAINAGSLVLGFRHWRRNYCVAAFVDHSGTKHSAGATTEETSSSQQHPARQPCRDQKTSQTGHRSSTRMLRLRSGADVDAAHEVASDVCGHTSTKFVGSHLGCIRRLRALWRG